MTAVNDESGRINDALTTTGENVTIPASMEAYKQAAQPFMLVVDDNYGEGSAREHAALQPRFFGCGLIVARSFARIHETNLKKQGVLPLWLVDKADYAKIQAGDMVSTRGLKGVLDGTSEGDRVVLEVTRDGKTEEVECRHTLSKDQVEWLRAGSALNWIGETAKR